jgi:hypothetical protein
MSLGEDRNARHCFGSVFRIDVVFLIHSTLNISADCA